MRTITLSSGQKMPSSARVPGVSASVATGHADAVAALRRGIDAA